MCGTARSSYTTRTAAPRFTTAALDFRGNSADRANDQTPCAGSRKGPSAGAGPMRRAPATSNPMSSTNALATRTERMVR